MPGTSTTRPAALPVDFSGCSARLPDAMLRRLDGPSPIAPATGMLAPQLQEGTKLSSDAQPAEGGKLQDGGDPPRRGHLLIDRLPDAGTGGLGDERLGYCLVLRFE